MKMQLAGLAVLILVLGFTCPGLADSRDYRQLNLKMMLLEGVPQVALREMADNLGWQLVFLPAEKIVSIKAGTLSQSLSIGQKDFNGEQFTTAPVIVDGRTYLSLDDATLLYRSLGGGQADLLTGLLTTKESYALSEKVEARIYIKNIGQEGKVLTFNSGQKYDLFLYQEGEEIWRWSEGKFFTMALVSKELKPGEELVYAVEIPREILKTGQYILRGELTDTQRMQLNEVTFEIKK